MHSSAVKLIPFFGNELYNITVAYDITIKMHWKYDFKKSKNKKNWNKDF